MRIKFLNWEKYQGDSKRYSSSTWFRMQNDLWQHDLWESLSDAEFRAFYFLIAWVSRRAHKNGETEINMDKFERFANIKAKIFTSAIEKLEQYKVLQCLHGECPGQSRGTHRETAALPNPTQPNQLLCQNGKPVLPPDLQTLWNSNCGKLPKIAKMTEKRRRKWSTRWGENPDLSYWENAIRRASGSKFCRGETDSGNWKLTADFLIESEDSAIKIYEGKYDDKNRKTLRAPPDERGSP